MRLREVLVPDIIEILHEDPAALREGLSALHTAEVAELVEAMPREDRLRLFNSIDDQMLAELMTFLDGESLKIALTRIVPQRLATVLERLESDDSVRILEIIPEEKRRPVLDAMSARGAEIARSLLRFEEGTAGRLMTTKFVRVHPEWTARQALDHLRTIDPAVATVANLYVVDDSDRLVGVVSLRRILPREEWTRIESLMTREVVAIPPETPQDEVAQIVSKFSFSGIPVIDGLGRPLGIVTVDDVLDVLVARETESALRMGAVQFNDEGGSRLDYFGASIWRVVRSRIGWLMLLFVAATFTGSVLRHFERELSAVVQLSFFIPLIIGTAGNAGSQTVSTVIRALALGQVELRNAMRVLVRETAAGFLLGVVLCAIATVRLIFWDTGLDLAFVVGLTMMAVCVWANLVGALVPMIAQRFDIDPTVVSAPLITTVVDGTGLAIYMLIAKSVLNL